MPEISKIQIGSTSYDVADQNVRKRVTALENNGGSGGGNAVVPLAERVKYLGSEWAVSSSGLLTKVTIPTYQTGWLLVTVVYEAEQDSKIIYVTDFIVINPELTNIGGFASNSGKIAAGILNGENYWTIANVEGKKIIKAYVSTLSE